MKIKSLPLAARILLFGTVLGGLAGVIVRVPSALRWSRSDLLAAAGLAVAIFIAEQFSVPLRIKKETLNFTLADAAWTTGLLIVHPSVLTVALVVGVLAGQLAKRWDPVKVAFNMGAYVIGITAAEVIYHAFDPQSASNPRAWAAAALAMAAFAAINVVAVSGIITLVERKPFSKVALPSLGLDAVHRLGNAAIGIACAALRTISLYSLPLVIVPLGLAFMAYRAWVEAIRERDQLRVLRQAEESLLTPLDTTEDLRPFLQVVKRMLGASSVELSILEPGQVTVHRADEASAVAPPANGNGNGHAPGALMNGDVSPQVAMIGGPEGVTGMLSIYREHELTDAERSVLDALGSKIAVLLGNRRLFFETLEQAQMADVVAHTWDGIFMVSREGAVLSWNPAMERITGLPREDVVGKQSSEVLGLELASGLTSYYDSPVVSGNGNDGNGKASGSHPETNGHPVPSLTRDVVLLHKDGAERWIRYTYHALRSPKGFVRGHVVVARDVTTDLETEQLKADFVAMVSHELRTPLTPLKGFLITLLRGVGESSPEERQSYYQIMLNQANRLEQLIGDLLEASRIESGTVGLVPHPVPVDSVISTVVRNFSEEQPDRAIRMQTPDQAVWVQGDPVRIDQIVTNLVSNAVKYSPRETPVEISVTVDAGYATISVSDHGQGIAAADQERIFERFYRVDNSMTRRTGGTGLGLYLAKRLVAAMHGRMWVRSAIGEGSSFAFTLPLANHSAQIPTGFSLQQQTS
jgi:signal transduction histidine kinase